MRTAPGEYGRVAGKVRLLIGIRTGWRWLRACVGLLVMVLTASLWLLVPVGHRLYRPGARLSFGVLCRGFGIRIKVHGTPLPGPGTLYVANHISWADIPVLAMVLDTAFVAKSEVRRWPAIGRFAWHFGCVFIERERRGTARAQADAVEQHLSGDVGLVLFPEGTTGDGVTVFPFRSSLFAQVAGEAQARVQPVTMVYRHRDGAALSDEESRQVAWTADDELLPNVAAFAARGGALVELWFEEPLPAGNRKELARASREAIVARLAVVQ